MQKSFRLEGSSEEREAPGCQKRTADDSKVGITQGTVESRWVKKILGMVEL